MGDLFELECKGPPNIKGQSPEVGHDVKVWLCSGQKETCDLNLTKFQTEAH